MSNHARVDSLEELGQFRTELCTLTDELRAELYAAESDLRRTIDWVNTTQAAHWKRQVRIRTEEYGRARSELNRKRDQRTRLDARQSCVEEEKALKRAEKRVEEARQKIVAVKQWSRKLEEAVFGYQSLAQGLMSLVDADVPRAVARLDAMARALEAYLAGGPAPEWASAEITESEMRRAAEPVADPVRSPDRDPGDGKTDKQASSE